MVQISRSFVGWGGVFAIKFNENIFREHSNKEELFQGVFISNNNGIGNFYSEILPDTSQDIISHFNLNLFDANKGIALDRVSYNVRIIASNIYIHSFRPTTLIQLIGKGGRLKFGQLEVNWQKIQIIKN